MIYRRAENTAKWQNEVIHFESAASLKTSSGCSKDFIVQIGIQEARLTTGPLSLFYQLSATVFLWLHQKRNFNVLKQFL